MIFIDVLKIFFQEMINRQISTPITKEICQLSNPSSSLKSRCPQIIWRWNFDHRCSFMRIDNVIYLAKWLLYVLQIKKQYLVAPVTVKMTLLIHLPRRLTGSSFKSPSRLLTIWKLLYSQSRIQNPVKHLRWGVLRK